MKRKKSILKWLGIIAAVCLAAFLAVFISNTRISTASYTVALENLESPLRLVLISDLHGKSFGKDNARLIAKIQEQTLDAIFLDGDMIDSRADSPDVQELLRLIESLCEIAPVYFSLGNHELEYMQTDTSLLTQVAEAGAVVVNDSYVDVTVAGQPLRIGGTMGYGFAFGRTEEEFTSSQEYVFLFIFNGAYTLWDVDLVLSGHTHGGLVRLPFIGGLYAPMQGLFPKYDRGYFQLGTHMQMVITSGLAGHGLLPRVNNLPEIVVVELVPKENG